MPLQVPSNFYGDEATFDGEATEVRVRRFARYLWERRNPAGRSGRDLFEFVIWGTKPPEGEKRLWMAINDPAWKIERVGVKMLGEAVGWARPDEFPPGNKRTNKALRTLGFDVKAD